MSPPVVELATHLSVPPSVAFYHWARVLCWLADNLPDGNVAGLTAEQLASAAGWQATSADTFQAAYVSACVDRDGNALGWDFAGQSVKRASAKRDDQAKRDAEDRKGNWLTPYADAWKEAYGGDMAVDRNVRDLKKLQEEYGEAEVLRRWTLMLKRQPADFAGAHKLRQAWGTYEGGTADGMTKRRRRATAFYDLLIKHGILSMSQAMQRIQQLETDGVIKSAEKFVELLRRCDRDLLRTARVPAFAHAHIEERLGDLLDG